MRGDIPGLLQTVYLVLMAGLLAFFVVWEAGSPRYAFSSNDARRRHLLRHAGLFVLLLIASNVLLAYVPAALKSLSLDGPSTAFTGLSVGLAMQVVLGVLILDCYEYLWHRACHRVPWLWRLHRVHHADTHIDFSTGMRFHPIENLASLVVKVLLLSALGLPLWIEAVRILANNPAAFAQHANVVFPAWVERWPRWLVITPELHRVHHSIDPAHYDRNFGELFSFWDRCFGTLLEPSKSVEHVGLPGYRDSRWHTLAGMLAMPWKPIDAAPAGYTSTRSTPP